MIEANGYFRVAEERLIGSRPRPLFAVAPYPLATGIGSGLGTFANCAYVEPGRIQVNAGPQGTASWTSAVLDSALARYPVPLTANWAWNTPGYIMTVEWRTAATATGCAAAAWQTLPRNQEVDLYQYYQWRVSWAGFRCWREPNDLAPGDWSYWSVPALAGFEDYASYWGYARVPGDRNNYIGAVEINTEFPLDENDVIQVDDLSLEGSYRQGEIVSGTHSLSLDNASGKYSPDRSDFIFAGQRWYRRRLKVELAYDRQARAGQGMYYDFYRAPMYGGGPAAVVYDKVLLYEGEIIRWRCSLSGGESPELPSVTIESRDWLAALLDKRLGVPLSDGTRQPALYGSLLLTADKLAGHNPDEPERTLDFEAASNSFDSSDDGVSQAEEAAYNGSRGSKHAITAAGGKARGAIYLSSKGLLAAGMWQIAKAPAGIHSHEVYLAQVMSPGNDSLLILAANNSRNLAVWAYGMGSEWEETNIKIGSIGGIWGRLAMGVDCESGNAWVWLDDEEVFSRQDDTLKAVQVGKFFFGPNSTGGHNEAWTLYLDDLQIWPHYYPQCYQAAGKPFTQIGAVYIDKAVVARKNYDSFPEYGAVNFIFKKADGSLDQDRNIGTTQLRATVNEITQAGAILTDLLTRASLGERLDADSFAAVSSLHAAEVISAQFEDTNFADSLREILSRYLLSVVMDQGQVRLVNFLETSQAVMELHLEARALLNKIQQIAPQVMIKSLSLDNDFDDLKNKINCTWGWHERNPRFSYQPQAETLIDDLGEFVEDLDLTYGAPVSTAGPGTARAIADRMLARLSAPAQVLEVVTDLAAARINLGDMVTVNSSLNFDTPKNFMVFAKNLSLATKAVTLRAYRPLEVY